jgi:hypothetical protein
MLLLLLLLLLLGGSLPSFRPLMITICRVC